MSYPVAADLILTNGNIWRGRAEGRCQALAIWQGKVLAHGTDTEMLVLKGADTDVIDLEGRFASPGLIDNHLHPISTGLVMGWVDVTAEAAPTAAALLDRLREGAARTPEGGWVRARGYDQVKLDTGHHPTREDLDRAVPDHPVMVRKPSPIPATAPARLHATCLGFSSRTKPSPIAGAPGWNVPTGPAGDDRF